MRVEDVLRTFGKRVQQQARANLTRNKMNASGGLYDATKYDLQVGKNSFSLSFEMPEYWQYQDSGVSGTEKKYNTPFKYTNKKPPARVFESWAKQKGIKPRGKDGRFTTFKSFGFAVANSVFKKGIKPTKFFTKPFENEFNKLPDDIVEAYALDIDNLLTFTTNG
jgi:hypothetical protein